MNSQKLLTFGMLAGLLFALSDMAWQVGSSLDPSVLAQVDDYQITREQFENTVSGIEEESKRRLSSKERSALLNRMVEEYLLIQYAKSQDLLMSNPELRRRAVDLLLQTLREQAESLEPETDELTEFVQTNPAYFSGLTIQSDETAPLFDSVVISEWRRRKSEELLEDLLANLREQANVKQVNKP